jgi:hypothetical protein
MRLVPRAWCDSRSASGACADRLRVLVFDDDVPMVVLLDDGTAHRSVLLGLRLIYLHLGQPLTSLFVGHVVGVALGLFAALVSE